MGSRLTIHTPEDFVLSRDVCSYGYFVLAPNVWDAHSQTLARVLNLPEGPARVVLSQAMTKKTNTPNTPNTPSISTNQEPHAAEFFSFPHEPGAPLRAVFDRRLTRDEQTDARHKIGRMLRLDEDAAHSAAFHALDPRWKASGRSRLFRSPTLFEDIVKTVTSCNVTWPGTMNMNRRFCEVLGQGGSFPTAARMARIRPGTLRGRCRVGYRDSRLVELAKLFVSRKGKPAAIDEAWLEDHASSDDAVFAFLKTLPGIGPYAAGNSMMLLGRYSRLALDTESLRHGKAVLGLKGTDASIMKQLAKHYESFGQYRFKSYWFELWTHYQTSHGPSHTWDRQAKITDL